MAYSIYSPTYAADSPYIRETVRDDPRFLLAGAAAWVVRSVQPTPLPLF
jgi:very-long-chain enoyl-CoA reductase